MFKIIIYLKTGTTEKETRLLFDKISDFIDNDEYGDIVRHTDWLEV